MEAMYSTEEVLEDVKNVIDGFVELFGASQEETADATAELT